MNGIEAERLRYMVFKKLFKRGDSQVLALFEEAVGSFTRITPNPRKIKALRMYLSGKTQKDVGLYFKVSPNRGRQLIHSGISILYMWKRRYFANYERIEK